MDERHAELVRMITEYRVTQAIHVAAALGIADLLADGPRTSDELADSAGAHRDALSGCSVHLRASGSFARRTVVASRSLRSANISVPTYRDRCTAGLPSSVGPTSGRPGGIFCTASEPARTEERRVGKECRSRWSP